MSQRDPGQGPGSALVSPAAGMLFKRQPTTRTLLLFVALFAVVLAIARRSDVQLLVVLVSRLMFATVVATSVRHPGALPVIWSIANEAIFSVRYLCLGLPYFNSYRDYHHYFGPVDPPLWFFDPVAMSWYRSSLWPGGESFIGLIALSMIEGTLCGAACAMLSRTCRRREEIQESRSNWLHLNRKKLILIAVLEALALAGRTYARSQVSERNAIFKTYDLHLADQPRWHVWLFGDDPTCVATTLFAERTATNDNSLSLVSGLRKLDVLNIGHNPITNAGLRHLKRLDRLETLYVSCTQITDAGLAQLKQFPQLKRLSLGNDHITDAGLIHLREMPQLQLLFLGGTLITDAGLVHLKGLKQLQVLDLSETRVTEAGILELQKALPNCRIDR